MREPQDTKLDAELVQGPPAGGPEAKAMEDRLAAKLFGDTGGGGAWIGRFQVVERIGAGGMGVVYLARDPKLGRDVAIKLLHAGSLQREVDRARLMREGHALAKLSHQNVVHLYDVEEHEGSVFLAMEHVDGIPLKEWQAQPRRWRDVLAVYLQAGEGLAAAHAAGLVHRDFKPANVLVCADPQGARSFGRVCVLDFGLAREPGMPGEGGSGSLSPAAASLPSGNLTHTGAVLGTPAYMSPEQVRGDPLDARADQFSFCVALWEALYGERPYGDTVPLSDERVSAPKRAVLPGRAQRALLRGLSARPADRFAHMRDLLLQLRPRAAGRSRAAMAFAAGIGLAGVASAMAMGGEKARQCDAVADVSAVWSAERRDALREVLAGVPGEWDASRAIDRAMADLDAYAEGWAVARGDLCREQPTMSVAQHDAQRACLDRRRQQLASTVEILAAADAEVLIAAPQLLDALPPVEACAEVEVPARAQSTDVQTWQAAVDHAVLLEAAGRIADAKAALHDVLEAMGDAEAPRVRGDAAMLRAKIAWSEDGEEAAKDLLFEAATLAQASGDDELAARAWIELALRTTDKNAGDATDAARWLALGEAALSQLGEAPRLRADALATRGQLAKLRGEHDAALRDLTATVELVRAQPHASPLQIARAMNRLGNAQVVAEKLEDAQATYRAAMTIVSEALGEQHPELGVLHKNLGFVAQKRGQTPSMLEHLRRALAIDERAYGPHADRLGGILVRLGQAALLAGDHDEAIALGRRAAAIQASLPTEHMDSGGGLIVVAMAQIEAETIAEARTTLEELLPRLGGEVHESQRLDVLQNLGFLSMRLEEWAVARDWYETLAREAKPGSEKAMRAREGVGQCEIRLGEIQAGLAKLEAVRAAAAVDGGASHWSTAVHLAIGYEKMGDRARARALAAEVERDPDRSARKREAEAELDALLGSASRASGPAPDHSG